MPKKVTSLIEKVIDSDTKKTIQCVYNTPKFNHEKTYHCMWCTFKIDDDPLGCPLYLKKKLFVTYGVFCSFNCIKAHVQNHEHDAKFSNSIRLLALMYTTVTGKITPVTIDAAPHIALLSIYGGNMSELQYKQTFNRIIYTEKGLIQMFPITTLYEEEEKFV